MPLIAILRGLTPGGADEVSDALVEAGIRIMEVPLNSPDPLASIERIRRRHGERIIIGAGTVLSPGDATDVVNAGGQIIVAPNMVPEVGAKAIGLGAIWCPGVLTPSEAFEALRLGAALLKFFPAELVPPKAIAAMRAVLPKEANIAAVGGIDHENMQSYFHAGSNCFGLGSALFKPEYAMEDIGRRAVAFVETFRKLVAA
jgi:2-dehydro-3-deoxyphosphogalactonate aldolase